MVEEKSQRIFQRIKKGEISARGRCEILDFVQCEIFVFDEYERNSDF